MIDGRVSDLLIELRKRGGGWPGIWLGVSLFKVFVQGYSVHII
jgi:hypothetical protein